jgi:hypothetical protein
MGGLLVAVEVAGIDHVMDLDLAVGGFCGVPVPGRGLEHGG